MRKEGRREEKRGGGEREGRKEMGEGDILTVFSSMQIGCSVCIFSTFSTLSGSLKVTKPNPLQSIRL